MATQPTNKLYFALVNLFYRGYQRLYPAHFRTEFGEEMGEVFQAALSAANAAGKRNILQFLIIEAAQAPSSLFNVYSRQWRRWLNRILSGFFSPDLSDFPIQPDGRSSRQQAFFELAFFLGISFLMILELYSSPGTVSDWIMYLTNWFFTPLTAVLFCFAVSKSLPRWGYPLGGYLLGESISAANSSGLLPVLILVYTGFFALGIVVLLMHLTERSVLPIIGLLVSFNHLKRDWSRLSFGLFGLLPALVWWAYQDTFLHATSPIFILSMFSLIGGAWGFIRSRARISQIIFLLAGTTTAYWLVLVDQVYHLSRQVQAGIGYQQIWISAGFLIEPYIFFTILLLISLIFTKQTRCLLVTS
jgi:hypothetical protein